MKILFIVCGEGLGHTSRCIHLGHYLQQNGHTIHYAAYGKSYDFLHEHRCANIHRGWQEACLEGNGGFFSLKKTLWCSKGIVFNLLMSALTARRLIKKLKVDCVVCDTMYAGVIAARFRRVPVIFITNQNHFNGHNGEIHAVWRILNFLIRRYLKLAKAVIIPDYPEPYTVSEYNISIPAAYKKRYHFTGPFLDVEPARYMFSRRTIFASFGGEPYKLPLYQMLKNIADKRKDLCFDVFYTGANLPDSTDNFRSHGYVPNLYEHLAAARIAIVHGGLTTLHEALLFEKPVLIMMDPGHPEQQNNAKKIVDMGAGTCVDGRTITPEVLEQKIAETLALVPKPFRDIHAATNGRKNAADIIEEAGSGKYRVPDSPTIRGDLRWVFQRILPK